MKGSENAVKGQERTVRYLQKLLRPPGWLPPAKHRRRRRPRAIGGNPAAGELRDLVHGLARKRRRLQSVQPLLPDALRGPVPAVQPAAPAGDVEAVAVGASVLRRVGEPHVQLIGLPARRLPRLLAALLPRVSAAAAAAPPAGALAGLGGSSGLRLGQHLGGGPPHGGGGDLAVRLIQRAGVLVITLPPPAPAALGAGEALRILEPLKDCLGLLPEPVGLRRLRVLAAAVKGSGRRAKAQ